MTTPIQAVKILHKIKSGIEFELTPLTVLGQQRFKDIAAKLYPDPDPTPFEKPEINGFLPDQKTSAGDDPEYRRLVAEAVAKREFAYRELVIDTCLNSASKAALLENYQEQLKLTGDQSVWIPVPKEFGENITYEIKSPWVALLHFFLCSLPEIAEMMLLIQGKLPLTEGEVIGAFAYFRRLPVQRADRAGTTTGKVTLPLATDRESNPVAS